MMVKIQGPGRDRMERWLIETLGPDMEVELKTIQEYMREELLEEAKRKVRAEGRAEGRAEILFNQLQARFESVSTGDEQRLRGGSPEELDTWALRILTAGCVAEVFDPVDTD